MKDRAAELTTTVDRMLDRIRLLTEEQKNVAQRVSVVSQSVSQLFFVALAVDPLQRPIKLK